MSKQVAGAGVSLSRDKRFKASSIKWVSEISEALFHVEKP